MGLHRFLMQILSGSLNCSLHVKIYVCCNRNNLESHKSLTEFSMLEFAFEINKSSTLGVAQKTEDLQIFKFLFAMNKLGEPT